MPQLPPIKKLILATHNAGKVKEFAALINHDGLELLSAAQFHLPEPEETGASFAENAAIKALAAAKATGLPALSDDSGLCVDALDGAPGIYSARWMNPGAVAVATPQGGAEQSRQTNQAVAVAMPNAGPVDTPLASGGSEAAHQQNPAFTKIETLLREKGMNAHGANAAFICVLALCWPNGETQFFKGRVDGHLCFPPRGAGGFGYDPIFIPVGETRSFAEMRAEEKHRFSHRARAAELLKCALSAVKE